MRPEFSANQRRQLRLNASVTRAASKLVQDVEARWRRLNAVDRLLVTLFNKCVRTFDSIQVLTRRGAIEDGLCLLRILVENTINLKYAITSGPVDATRRYHDWAILDAVRRARSQNFYRGTSQYSKDREAGLLEAEKEIRSRYAPAEIEGFKRKGVFGVSLEDRAKRAGLDQLYTFSYRITSRNVHAIDVAELRSAREGIEERDFAKFIEVRLDHLLSVSRFCVGTLSLWFDAQYRCGLSEDLEKLRTRDVFPVQF